jgi:hypothetical protein
VKGKTKLIILAAFIMGVMFSFYSIYSDIYIMTDEQYAQEAQKIVNDSLSPCQSPIEPEN